MSAQTEIAAESPIESIDPEYFVFAENTSAEFLRKFVWGGGEESPASTCVAFYALRKLLARTWVKAFAIRSTPKRECWCLARPGDSTPAEYRQVYAAVRTLSSCARHWYGLGPSRFHRALYYHCEFLWVSQFRTSIVTALIVLGHHVGQRPPQAPHRATELAIAPRSSSARH